MSDQTERPVGSGEGSLRQSPRPQVPSVAILRDLVAIVVGSTMLLAETFNGSASADPVLVAAGIGLLGLPLVARAESSRK